MRRQFLGCGDAFGSGGRFNTCFRPPQAILRASWPATLGASGRSPTKNLSIVKQRARVHGRRLSWLLGWHRSVDLELTRFGGWFVT